MPRRTKKKKADATNTYYKAKNGRFYKKVQIDGKTRVRFVSNAEATGALKLSEPKKSKKPARKAKQPRKKKEEPQPATTSQERDSVESDEKA